ncbi:MAG TPA: NAD(P)-dependent oxidoreductase [Gemmataceae bacterium]|nr:NAD(P)-dependent oxidoreductase [Gemmataceae bacterium]
MRIFITGGTGFLGRPLCMALREHELLVLSRNPANADLPARMLQGDLFEPALWTKQLQAFQPETCLHLAWSNLPDYSLANCAKNFHAGLELFQCLVEMRCPRLVITGTCFEYSKLTGCVTEDRIGMAPSVFPAFKTAQRIVGESLFSQSSTTFLWARPFFVYGPGQRKTSLIPSVIQSFMRGVPPEIQTPRALQDFIHVDDVASGLAKLATSEAPAGIYNLGSGRATRVADIVNLIARLLHRPEVYPHDPTLFPSGKENGEGGFWASTERMQKQTGWRPLVSLEEGIRKTLTTLRDQS